MNTALIRRALEEAGYTMTDKGTSYDGSRWYFTLYGPCVEPREYVGFGENEDTGQSSAWSVFLHNPIIPALIAAAFVDCIHSYTAQTVRDNGAVKHGFDCLIGNRHQHTWWHDNKLEAMCAAIVAAKEEK